MALCYGVIYVIINFLSLGYQKNLMNGLFGVKQSETPKQAIYIVVIFLLKKTWPLGNQTSKRKVIQKFLNPIEKKGQKN